MAMNVTDPGIDWDRVPPEDIEWLEGEVTERAKECKLPAADSPFFRGGHHLKYETRGGETVCTDCAHNALWRITQRWTSDRRGFEALQNAIGTKRADAFAAHVQQGSNDEDEAIRGDAQDAPERDLLPVSAEGHLGADGPGEARVDSPPLAWR